MRYGPLARIYDATLGNSAYPDTVRAFERARRKHRIGFRVAADVGCGTGRFLTHLARGGARVYGVDRSPEMLRRAVPRARRAGARLLRQDLRALRLPERADLITCNFDTMNYFLRQGDLRAAVRALARNLRSGGALVFDFIPRVARGGRIERMTQRVVTGPVRSTWRHRLNHRRGRSTVRIDIARPGPRGTLRRESEVHRQRWWPPAVIRKLLREAGLEVLAIRPMTVERAHDWLQVAARRI